MRKRNRPSKQVDWIRIGGRLLLFAAVLPVFSIQAVAETVEYTSVYTSTESVLEKSYEELIESLDKETFGDYLSTLETGDSYIIPGIDKTNIRNEVICDGMIPQGLCVAQDYLIISAYDNSHKVNGDNNKKGGAKQRSVLYIMDVESKQYLTTITLDTKCHVGALAYNPDAALIYIADSTDNVVQMLSMDKIEACVLDGQDAKTEVVEFDKGAIDTQGYIPSFLAYYQGHLYVGQFARLKWGELLSNQMAVFKQDGTLVEQDTIQIPYYAQGVAFADWKDKTYMLISASYGRNEPAKLHVYRMEHKEDGSLRSKHKVGAFHCPNMSEDIDVQGDSIYTCYESASNFYRLALDDNGESSNAIDRIMVSSFTKTIGKLLTGDANRYVHRIMAIPLKYRRYNQVCVDIDQRRRLFLRLS